MRERAPGAWELIVEAGRDPLTGKRRQVSRMFYGTMRDAKQARAELLVEVGRGKHQGTSATVETLFNEWIAELERKGRSPNTVYGYRKVYERNIRPSLGATPIRKVSTKMLTDLYGAHHRRGLGSRSIHQIHACCSSMFTQACRWGWRDSNPAQWAEPPAMPNVAPVVPTPEEVRLLIEAAEASRRPEYARAIVIASTTGVRRAELCALRFGRDVDRRQRCLIVSRSIVALPRQDAQEIPTKNRRVRMVALDDLTLSMFEAQLEFEEKRAASIGCCLVPDAFVFSDAPDGREPWRPDAITKYFDRLRTRVGLAHLSFHDLRKFMETYGQQLGFSASQVAMRAGHDPSVATRHYTGSVAEADRRLAVAVASLLAPAGR
jgi:integrase